MADFDFRDAGQSAPRPEPSDDTTRVSNRSLRVIAVRAVLLTVMAGTIYGVSVYVAGRGAAAVKGIADAAEKQRIEDAKPIVPTVTGEPPAAGTWLVIGDTHVRVSRAAVERGRLAIDVQVRNRSATKKLDLLWWGQRSVARSADDAGLTDEHGNRYTCLDGTTEHPSIHPGKEAQTTLTFEQPVDAAKSLTLALKGANIGTPGVMGFRIGRDFWTRPPEKK